MDDGLYGPDGRSVHVGECGRNYQAGLCVVARIRPGVAGRVRRDNVEVLCRSEGMGKEQHWNSTGDTTMKFMVNGQEVTPEEFRSRHRNQGKLKQMLETRTPPGGHEPYWGVGHESISSGVPSSQAQEHHDWCQSEGLTGVEVQKDGTVKTSSPENRRKYLAARGLADAGSAGSDARALKKKTG